MAAPAELAYRLIPIDQGWFGFVARQGRLVSTYLPRRKRDLLERIERDFPGATFDEALMSNLVADVRNYFAGRQVAFRVELDLTEQPPFRRAVLEACRKIPYGKTSSYSELARLAGSPKAVRAAGGTMANNPLPLVIPCHRVLRSDGSIGGFSSPSGLDDKRRMLRLEGVLDKSDESPLFRKAV